MSPRIKLTIEQKRERKRESNRRYYLKKKTDKEFERLDSIKINELYPTGRKLDHEQRQFIFDLMNQPISEKVQSKNHSLDGIKRQLGVALSRIKSSRIGSIDFDLRELSKEAIEYFFSQLPAIIEALLTRINLDDHWTVFYEYGDCSAASFWKQRTIDSITQQYLRDQIKYEISENQTWEDFSEERNSGDSFFPISIRELTQLRFVNEDEVGLRGRQNNLTLSARDFSNKDTYAIYAELVKSKASPDIIRKFIKKHTRNKRTGKFWRWLNLIPEVNLERYMIFHSLNSRTVQIIERDNCFIYACRMAGLDEHIIDNMRAAIHKRSFGLIDVQRVSTALNLSFEIKTNGKLVRISPGGIDELFSNPIKLLLLENHYMIRERVPVSPYFIKHRSEILSDPRYKHLPMSQKLLIYSADRHRDKPNHSLAKVLKSMFEVNAFKPINNGDYMVFNSMVCYEAVDPIKSLEYNTALCTKLKKPSPK